MKAKKLTAQEFALAVQLGLGSALLHVKEYGDDGIELIILDALLINYVYDMQIEGDRVYWLMQLVTLSGRVRFYAGALLAKLQKKKKYKCYDMVQQICLSHYFFELGFIEFLPVMFSKFRQLSAAGGGGICGVKLFRVAGLAGLEFVAQVLGSNQKNIEDDTCFEILEDAREEFGEEVVDVRLKVLSLKNDDIRLFLDACARHQANREKTCLPRQALSLPFLVDALEDGNQSRFAHMKYRRFGRTASDQDLFVLFNMLLHTQDRRKQLALLSVFAYRSMPVFDSQLLNLVESESRQIQWAAAEVFAHFKNDLVRRKALKLFRQGREEMIPIALRLLAHNYRPEDAVKILSLLRSMQSREHIHSAGMHLRTIAEHAGDNELAPCFLWLYHNGPDSFCRESFVEQLIAWKKCPPKILYELQWDSRDETQYLARNQYNASQVRLVQKQLASL